MAACPRPPSWAIGRTEFNAGVLGETALPGDWGGNPTTLLTRFAEELPPSPRLRRTCRRAGALLRPACAGL